MRGLSFLAASALLLGASAPPLFAQEVTTVEFHSPAVDRTMRYNIVLPEGYEESTVRYPVLYLLHGAGQSYTTWAQAAPFYAGYYSLIIVMPDGGNSWYVNWAESEDGQANAWEDHIVRDVVGHVDANYRTLARREGRALSGLSMGGYGSLAIGLRNPDMFVSVGSTSGALEHARQEARRLRDGVADREPRERSSQPNPAIGIPGFSSQAERTPRGREFTTVEQAEAHDPFLLVDRAPRDRIPHIYLDCGTEDELIEGARELARALMEKDLPFDFMQMPGGHNGAYWIQSVGRIMAVQYEVMRRALGDRPVGARGG